MFRVGRTWGLGSQERVEPIGGFDFSQIANVYLNLVLQDPATYTLSNAANGSYVTFVTPPSSSDQITMDFSFFYRCRWLEDMEQYDQFMFNLWKVGKIAFRSVKP